MGPSISPIAVNPYSIGLTPNKGLTDPTGHNDPITSPLLQVLEIFHVGFQISRWVDASCRIIASYNTSSYAYPCAQLEFSSIHRKPTVQTSNGEWIV
jgi:hypothetical protein